MPHQAPKALFFLTWLLALRFQIMRRTAGCSGIRTNSRRFLRDTPRAPYFGALFFVLHGSPGTSSSRAFCAMASEQGSGRFRHLGINWSNDHRRPTSA